MNESGQESKQKSLQEQLEGVWKDKINWNEGFREEIEGLPEGTRFIMQDPHTYVLRIIAPNAPKNDIEGLPDDVPIVVFGGNYDPELIKSEALKIGKAIINGEIKITPGIKPQEGRRAA